MIKYVYLAFCAVAIACLVYASFPLDLPQPLTRTVFVGGVFAICCAILAMGRDDA